MDDTSSGLVVRVRSDEATGLEKRRKLFLVRKASPARHRARERVAARRNALTVLVPIQHERHAALEAVLTEIGLHIQDNPSIAFQQLKTTHFLRWIIVPGAGGEDGQPAGPKLLAFEANFDHTVGDFLKDLVRVAGTTLRERIYCHCDPPAPQDSDEALVGYLLDHALSESLFFKAYPELTVADIDNNARVREFIQRFLGESRKGRGEEARLHQDIRRHLEQVQRHEAVDSSERAEAAGPVLELDPETPTWKQRLLRRRSVRTGLLLLAMPVAIPTGLTLLGLAFVGGAVEKVKRGRSPLTERTYQQEDVERLGQLLEREDFKTQNQLTHLVDLKPGALRLLLIRLSFRIWGYLATYYFTDGKLGGIEGIHFARWVLIEDEVMSANGPRKKHRLLFFSNYDGSWEDYLGSFVDRASIGLTTIWCNTQRFPRSRLRRRPFRLELGADREEAFKRWTRQHQIPTQAWFSRNPDKSVSNIFNDREIRSKVKTRMNPKQLKDWLRRL